MKEKQFMNDKTNKKIEQIVLLTFTIFSLAMLVSSQLLKWSIFAKETILITICAGWFVFLKGYRNYEFRAKFLTVVSWINFLIYVFHATSFTSMLSTMIALIVLLSIFCLTDIIYMGVFFYHHYLFLSYICFKNSYPEYA